MNTKESLLVPAEKVAIQPPQEEGSYPEREFYLISDLKVVVDTGPELIRGTYLLDLYTSLSTLMVTGGYGVDLQQNTITTDMAASLFRSSFLTRVKQDNEALKTLCELRSKFPESKMAVVIVHGEVDPLSGKWKLEGKNPLVFADPVIYQLSENAAEKRYFAILILACNPGNVEVDMEGVSIPVFATIGDNSALSLGLKTYTAQISAI